MYKGVGRMACPKGGKQVKDDSIKQNELICTKPHPNVDILYTSGI